MAAVETLPPTDDVNEVDNKLGSFLSDLDSLTSVVESLEGDGISFDEALRLENLGIKWEPRNIEIDSEALARLLVFADELTTDAERITEYAEKLRHALLSLYRWHVLEGRAVDA
jgi:hypothetical protein